MVELRVLKFTGSHPMKLMTLRVILKQVIEVKLRKAIFTKIHNYFRFIIFQKNIYS